MQGGIQTNIHTGQHFRGKVNQKCNKTIDQARDNIDQASFYTAPNVLLEEGEFSIIRNITF